MACSTMEGEKPAGIFSILDTDLYKLTMQCCVLNYFPKVDVSYNYTNRTAHMKFTREAAEWIKSQIDKLENIKIADEELSWLHEECKFLTKEHLNYLVDFCFKPASQVEFKFAAEPNSDLGAIELHVKGLWVETILYEIPLLALISEGFFKFCDTEWTYDGQVENAYAKGKELLEAGCVFSEFGTRRRRDYHTQDLVMQGLVQAQKDYEASGKQGGRLSGTSNVHFAHKFGLSPVGTVAHEWYMGVAAITGDYKHANELALQYWVATFGPGTLGIALTDTFGSSVFLEAFKQHMPDDPEGRTYAQVFAGVRQDSGDPVDYIKTFRDFYDAAPEHRPKNKPVIVFSDSLNVEKCIHYREETVNAGLNPTFGVGTFLTNDFKNTRTGEKSVPLNIVIKLATANGKFAVKISDNIGKNTGDHETVEEVKKELGYVEKSWEEGDEAHRWDK